MRLLAVAKTVLGGTLVIACNAILGIGDDYHRVSPVDAGPKECRSHGDCAAKGELCLFGVCSRTCRKDADCPAGQRCLNTDEGAACVHPSRSSCESSECPGGTTCHDDGLCRSECIDSLSCAGDQTCSGANVCLGTLGKFDPEGADAGNTSAGGSPGNGDGGSAGRDGGDASDDGGDAASDAETGVEGAGGGVTVGAGGAGAGGAGTGGAGTGGAGTGGAGTGGAGTGGAGTGGAGTGGLDGGNGVNECLVGNGGCDANATCTDTAGGRTCDCNPGYSGTGLVCADVNECLTGNGGCHANPTCANTVGSRTCTCGAGYSGTGLVCADVNECLTGNGGCHANATCANTLGSRTCTCNTGYSGSGTVCTDINECLTGNGGCHANATCANTPGSRTCTCNTGYSGSGTVCTDINECSQGTDNCDSAATCSNTAGSFTCTCPANQAGDGTACMCDLNGTFAVRAELDIEWDAVVAGPFTLIAAGSTTVYAWALRRMTVTGGSSVQTDHIPCGSTVADLCSPYFGAAFQQVIPNGIWQGAGMPTFTNATTIADPDPGDPYVIPIEAILTGASLVNPLGAWPPAWDGVPALTWLDHDSDAILGITSAMTIGGTSASCGGDLYEGLPDPSILPSGNPRIDRIYTATRVLNGYTGTFNSCDVITGALNGPSSGQPQIDSRVRGCRKVGGTACTQTSFESVDDGGNTPQRVLAARFSMQRVPATTTCAAARAMSFP